MKRPQLVLALIWLMMVVAYVDRVNITIAGPVIARQLHLDPFAFGLVLASFTFGYALMQIPGGALADRFGARPLLIFALVFWSVFTGLTGLVTSMLALVVIRVCFGLGEGLENGAQFKLVGDYFASRERSTANGVFLSALSVGPALGAPVSGWLLGAVGWRALFWWSTIPGILVAVLLWALLPRARATGEGAEVERAAVTAPSDGWRDVLGSRTSWLAFTAYLCFNVAFWGFIGWMPTYLNVNRHIALSQLGLVASAPYWCGFVGTLLVGRLGSTVFVRRRPALVATMYVLAGIALSIAFLATSATQSIIGLSCAAFCFYGGFGPFWATALDLAPANMRGAFSGFINFGGQIGGFAAPIVVGWIATATASFGGGFAFMIGALLLSAISLWAIGRIGAQAHHALGDEVRLSTAS